MDILPVKVITPQYSLDIQRVIQSAFDVLCHKLRHGEAIKLEL